MVEPTMREVLARLEATEAELTTLRAALASRPAARLACRPRRPRRRAQGRLTAALVLALLVALVPVSVLAVSFSDLDQAGPEFRPSIQAIADAGITVGADDPASADPTMRVYNPKGVVTREQMAVFLAKTAGLGGTPPVANARTAFSATLATDATRLGGQPASFYQPADQPIANATTAQNALSAQTAQTAQTANTAASATTAGSITGQANSATIPATSANTPGTVVQRDAGGNFTAGTITGNVTGTATNASALGGVPAVQYVRAGDSATTRLHYAPYSLVRLSPALTLVPEVGPTMAITSSSTGVHIVVLPLTVPGPLLGVEQRVTSVRVCYRVSDAATKIDAVRLRRGNVGEATLVGENGRDLNNTANDCFQFTVPAQQVLDALYLQLDLAFANTGHTVRVHSLDLFLQPVAS